MSEVSSPPAAGPGLLRRWRMILRTTNPPDGALDPVSRWLVVTRAAVLPMTLTSGVLAGLLAVRHPDFGWGWFALAVLGSVLAHVANNLMNDLFDSDTGLDTTSYPRGLYAPHPILAGLTSRRGLVTSTLLVNLVDLAILVVLFTARGWPVVAFALAGLFVSVAYTAPPLRLKKRGMGEPSVLLVWGPLMVGGTYYAAVGELPWEVLAASVPYALLCTAVLMGKHTDKIPWDEPAGIRTVPVMLGEARGRHVTRALMVAYYPSLALLVVLDALPWPSLVALLGLVTLVKVWAAFDRPRPAEPPRRWPIWPLWFAGFAFVHTRRAGALFLAGLALAAVFETG